MVLLKLRRTYHAQVARWLETNAGERSEEYIGLIAEHLERAGEAQQAARYLSLSGARALRTSAFKEALELFQRALALLPEVGAARAQLLCQAGTALVNLGDYTAARQYLAQGLHLAQTQGQLGIYAEAANMLGIIASTQGDPELARSYLEQGLSAAQQVADQSKLAQIFYNLGWLEVRQGAYAAAQTYFTQSQAQARAAGDQHRLVSCLNGQGTVHCLLEDYEQALDFFEESLALSRAQGNRLSEAIALGNLGEAARRQASYTAAQTYYQAALTIHQEINSKVNIVLITGNLGHVAAALGADEIAAAYYREALRLAVTIQMLPYALESLAGWAVVLARAQHADLALTLLGLACHHPALQQDTQPFIEQALTELRPQLSSEAITAGLERGKALTLEDIVAEVLAA